MQIFRLYWNSFKKNKAKIESAILTIFVTKLTVIIFVLIYSLPVFSENNNQCQKIYNNSTKSIGLIHPLQLTKLLQANHLNINLLSIQVTNSRSNDYDYEFHLLYQKKMILTMQFNLKRNSSYVIPNTEPIQLPHPKIKGLGTIGYLLFGRYLYLKENKILSSNTLGLFVSHDAESLWHRLYKLDMAGNNLSNYYLLRNILESDTNWSEYDFVIQTSLAKKKKRFGLF